MSTFQNSSIFKRLPVLRTPKQYLSNSNSVKLSYASYESTNPPTDQDPPPLIVNHGLFGSKSNWNRLCKIYHERTRRKVIAVDSRNHGDSPHAQAHTYEHLALDLGELLTRLKLSKAAFLGHSMGGRAVMYFALKNPSLVDKLVVADISPIPKSDDLKSVSRLFNVLQNLTLPKNVPMSVARKHTDHQLARFIRDKSLRNFLLTNLVQKLDGSYMWRVNIAALVANFDEIAKFPSTPSQKFEGPVLFVGGGESTLIQKSDHTKILQLFPKADFKYIDGAGHWIHNEKPVEFLNCTIEFLNKI